MRMEAEEMSMEQETIEARRIAVKEKRRGYKIRTYYCRKMDEKEDGRRGWCVCLVNEYADTESV